MLVMDKGECLVVVEDCIELELLFNFFSCVVSNYEVFLLVGGWKEICIYVLVNMVFLVLLFVGEFWNGLKFDLVDMFSIWMGCDYLNMIFFIWVQNVWYMFYFIQEFVEWDVVIGKLKVYLMFYYDDGGDVEVYVKWVYVLVLLRQYMFDIGELVIIYFSFYMYDGEVQIYQFEYVFSYLIINY